jgi:hypothetical protein
VSASLHPLCKDGFGPYDFKIKISVFHISSGFVGLFINPSLQTKLPFCSRPESTVLL